MISDTKSFLLINRIGWLILLLWLMVVPAQGTTFQFEVLGASEEWVVLRENIPPSPGSLDACRYPGLDPALAIGVKVHFLRLSQEMKRGILSPAGPFESTFILYDPVKIQSNCTSPEASERNWKEIEMFAENQGLRLKRQTTWQAIWGTQVPDQDCVVIEKSPKARQSCDQIYETIMDGHRLKLAVSLLSVPEAPDEKKCQSVGYRFGAALQVKWLDIGRPGTGSAPGGFATHFDCRPQLFMPLRLYLFEDRFVLLSSFKGNNIADRDEYPFLLVFSRYSPK
jgi:hypothetical protein